MGDCYPRGYETERYSTAVPTTRSPCPPRSTAECTLHPPTPAEADVLDPGHLVAAERVRVDRELRSVWQASSHPPIGLDLRRFRASPLAPPRSGPVTSSTDGVDPVRVSHGHGSPIPSRPTPRPGRKHHHGRWTAPAVGGHPLPISPPQEPLSTLQALPHPAFGTGLQRPQRRLLFAHRTSR